MQPIDLTMAVEQPIDQARTQILESVDARLRPLGYTQQPKADAIEYRPKVAFPVVVWAARRLRGERVSFTFDQHGSTTDVRATGRLRDRAHAEVTEALGGH